jgi:hypothetical protein
MANALRPGWRKPPSFNAFGRRERAIHSASVQKTRRIDRITDRADAHCIGRRPDVRSAVAAPGFEGLSRRQPAAGPALGTRVWTAARCCHPLRYAKADRFELPSLFGRKAGSGGYGLHGGGSRLWRLPDAAGPSVDLPRGIARTHAPSLGSPPSTPRCDRIEIASLVHSGASEMS